MGKTCKEYQEDLKINAINDKNAKKDKEALEVLNILLEVLVFYICVKKLKENDSITKSYVLSWL